MQAHTVQHNAVLSRVECLEHLVSALKQQSALSADLSKSAAHEDLVGPSKPDVVIRPDTAAEAGKRASESRVDGVVQGPKSDLDEQQEGGTEQRRQAPKRRLRKKAKQKVESIGGGNKAGGRGAGGRIRHLGAHVEEGTRAVQLWARLSKPC